MPKLTEKAIKAAKPRKRLYKLADERGLYLWVMPKGGRWWRLRYRYGGREKMLSLGTYPDVPLAKARDDRDEARRLVAAGVDPSERRKADKKARADTFEAIAREWLDRQAPKLTASTVTIARRRLERHIFPHLGSKPIASITTPDLLRVLRRIETRATPETAHRVKQLCSRVFRYAAASGRASGNPAANLREALTPAVSKKFAAITDKAKFGELLRAIDGYAGQPVPVAALKLAPLLFVRPGELRQAKWVEIDLKAGQWVIPAERMKMRREHIVPLSKQAVSILKELHKLTASGDLVFPGLRPKRPISENTMNAALRALGYDGNTHVAHGFRASASSLLHELGFPPEVIELQLAHAQRNQVAASYNRSARLEERKRMMQSWADTLDRLRSGKKASNVTPIRRGSAA